MIATSRRTSIGLDIAGTALCVSSPSKDGTGSSPARSQLPPAVVLGAVGAERPRVSIGEPLPDSGSGLPWPPTASLTESGGCARYPLALAWASLERSNAHPWRWTPSQGNLRDVEPRRAIAMAAVHAMRQRESSDAPLALVVPNRLDLTRQEELIHELRLEGLQPTLLWRPVAGALAWTSRFATEVLETHPEDDSLIGTLLVVHLGLEGFEITRLGLMPRTHAGARYLLPARKLPELPSLPEAGLEWAEAMASHVHRDAMARAWHLLWCTPWLSLVCNPALGDAVESPSLALHPRDVLERGREAWLAICRELDEPQSIARYRGRRAPAISCARVRWTGGQASEVDLRTWIADIREHLEERQELPTLGAVGTGCFATLPFGHATLFDHVLDELYTEDRALRLLEGRDPGVSALNAQGATTFMERLLRGAPTYLDRLPELEALVLHEGEPSWVNILGTKDQFVPGGRPWRNPTELPLKAAAEDVELKLSVWQEGDERVKRVRREFPRPIAQDTPVHLRVSMTPGQGNPKVQVIPEDRNAFGGVDVFLDWKRCEFSKFDKQGEADNEPRTNPPLEPRQSSALRWNGGSSRWLQAAWSGLRPSIRFSISYVRRRNVSADSLADHLQEIRNELRAYDPDARHRTPVEHATAVGSDGELDPSALEPELLAEFTETLDELLAAPRVRRSARLHGAVLRTLAVCSADTPNLSDELHDVLSDPGRLGQHKGTLRGAYLYTIGNCVRDPERISLCALGMLRVFGSPSPWLPNDWMRCLCRLLQYREHAARAIDSEVCSYLSSYLVEALHHELDQHKAQFLYRHASLAITYLLRRRKYDDGYLDPSSDLALQIKQEFERAIRLFRASKLTVVRGFVDLEHVTQLMIDYIDRKGRGRLGFAGD